MVTAPSAWLSFSITPVQGFIAAARTVRDLKVGSALLCHLVRVAMQAAKSGHGTLLYPVVDDATLLAPAHQLHLPNRFLAAFDSEGDATTAASASVAAVIKEWQGTGDRVHELLRACWDSPCPCWDQGWEDQINSFWEIRTTVVPSVTCTPGLAKQLVGVDRGQWGRQWDVGAALHAMGKQVRFFRGDHGIGRAKCCMMGELEQMGPGGAIGEQARFWTETACRSHAEGIRINERDRLCAVSLTKRFAPVCLDALAKLKEPIPDTAWIATAQWQARAEEHVASEWQKWKQATDSLTSLLREAAETPGRYLVTADLTPEALAKESPSETDPEAVKDAAGRMLSARRALMKQAGKLELGTPPRYLAALALDGDRIGERLAGKGISCELLGPERLAQISSALRSYAERVGRIVNTNHGTLIYAGGDDALALLPVATALNCAQQLHQEFPDLLEDDGGEKGTVSVGVALFHLSHDLRDALRRTRDAVQEAKKLGRDALGWQVVRRSGNAAMGVMSWEALAHVADLARQFEDGASDRWVYRLAEATAGVDDFVDRRSLESVIKHHVSRSQRDGGSSGVAQRASQLWRCLQEFARCRATSDRPINTVMAERDAFINTVGLASFVARKGAGDGG